jgi:hypothetical protein
MDKRKREMEIVWQAGGKNSMMKWMLTIMLFFASLIAAAQTDSVSLKAAMSGLDKALINKDEKVLQQLLHKDVSYGHSSGWWQNKNDIVADFKSGKLVYNRIENSSVVIVSENQKWATVRTDTNAEGELDHKAFQLKLHVLQVWIKTKNGWQLLARQSTKL